MKKEDQYKIKIIVEEIVTVVNSAGNEMDDQASTVQPLRISHIYGVKALETSMKYVEQQAEAMVRYNDSAKMARLGSKEMTNVRITDVSHLKKKKKS